jgi:hypothetical protein
MLGAGGSGIGAALGTERTIIQLSQIIKANSGTPIINLATPNAST